MEDREILAHQKELKDDSLFNPSFDHLLNYSQYIGSSSADAVQSLAKNNPFGAGSKRAFVVSSKAMFGMTRMFQSYVVKSGNTIEIFDNLEAALEWLDVVDYPFSQYSDT